MGLKMFISQKKLDRSNNWNFEFFFYVHNNFLISANWKIWYKILEARYDITSTDGTFESHSALWTFLVPKAAIKIIVKIARFPSSCSCNFCHILWFFWVLEHIWHFEKSSNTAKFLEKIKKNLPIILLLKWLLLKPKKCL